ncbi:hypothetical protein OQ279_14940 [Salinimicrobium sp. MT39]|uniref:Uncharacterized protein n=1 Tax=Salinimicrobium profundisediminis TaxID=2994553 RepID=A0A9X3D1V1_9FLAO|nr:hypothetical protein [Salinimicrobium profundisediminis]MCX2839445.1 hypothetical protein [Salinimicrobium profundisediminis]
MVVLKKIRGASLVETLTASVIIVVVFMIASFSFNNVFLNSVKSDDNLLQNRLEEVKYLTTHDKLQLPFYEEGPYWTISAEEANGKLQLEVQNLRNGSKSELKLEH